MLRTSQHKGTQRGNGLTNLKTGLWATWWEIVLLMVLFYVTGSIDVGIPMNYLPLMNPTFNKTELQILLCCGNRLRDLKSTSVGSQKEEKTGFCHTGNIARKSNQGWNEGVSLQLPWRKADPRNAKEPTRKVQSQLASNACVSTEVGQAASNKLFYSILTIAHSVSVLPRLCFHTGIAEWTSNISTHLIFVPLKVRMWS